MNDFPSIGEVQIILDEIAEEIPWELFNRLNEGIAILPNIKYHPESTDENPLYILGEYRRSFIGRNIVIYCGSFQKIYNEITERRLRRRFKDTLLHEFTHHLESLAGEKGLDIKDVEYIQRFRSKVRKREGVGGRFRGVCR